MKINFLKGTSPTELRKKFPNSMFLEELFDDEIVGVTEDSQSIIYNLYGVIDSMIKDEYPSVKVESDKWFDCYDEMNERICFGDGMYGLENLQDYLEGDTGYYNTDFSPYTFCDDPDVIGYNGNENSIEVELINND